MSNDDNDFDIENDEVAIEAEESEQDDKQTDEQPKFKYQKPEETEEDYAKRLGWKPKEKWKGEDDGHLSAEDFLKEREDSLAAQKIRNKEVINLNKTIMRQLAEVTKSQNEFRKEQQEKSKREAEFAYRRGVTDAENRLQAAVDDGDSRAAREAAKHLSELEKGYDAVKREQDQRQKNESPYTQEEMALMGEYMEDNPWYNANPELKQKMDKKFVRLMQKGLSVADALEEADDYIQPHVAQNLKPRMKAPLPIVGENSKGADKTQMLNDEYKQAFKDFMGYFDGASDADKADAKKEFFKDLPKEAYRRTR